MQTSGIWYSFIRPCIAQSDHKYNMSLCGEHIQDLITAWTLNAASAWLAGAIIWTIIYILQQ